MMNMQFYRMLQERNEKEFRYFKLSEDYFPKYHEEVLSGKFYARHEAQDLTKADPVLVDTIKTYCDKRPKEKYDWPVTENQMYGWFNKPLTELDRNDRRFYCPARVSEMTRLEMNIKKDINMKQEKFTGIPWR